MDNESSLQEIFGVQAAIGHGGRYRYCLSIMVNAF